MARKVGSHSHAVRARAQAAPPKNRARIRPSARRSGPRVTSRAHRYSAQNPPTIYEMYHVEQKQTARAAMKGPAPRPATIRSSASRMRGSQITPSSHMMQME